MRFLKAIVFLYIFCLFDVNRDEEKAYDIVYLINLDSSPDRLVKMKTQLDAFGIKFVRFKAVDGTKLKIVNLKTNEVIEDAKTFDASKKFEDGLEYKVSSGDFSIKYRTDSKFIKRYISYGELGCAMSHYAIMKDIIKNRYKRAIVFEDDIVFEKDFNENLELIMANVQHDFDILFLDVGICGEAITQNVSKEKIKSIIYIPDPDRLLRSFEQVPNNEYIVKISEKNILYGTHAYCISLAGAKKMILLTDSVTLPIDEQMFHNNALTRYVSKKKMLYISEDTSTLEKGRGFSGNKNTICYTRIEKNKNLEK
ncbi:MAG: glycosyltransferase family 25 protein [Holosporaceae bacterium]|jgi:GR25 family glycosyltransferase involved in LPS biosynthesis|nr:glycosyltransferase family 25 protein [Holosporaceae bacterium]